MLTTEHAIFRFEKGRILPDRLTTGIHRHYLGYAERMLDLYRGGTGKTRQVLHRGVHKILEEEPDCPTRRVDAFCKLLDDEAVFERDPEGKAPALRKRVFSLAAPMHPLVAVPDQLFGTEEEKAKAGIAASVGRPWEEIEQSLFSDVIEFHRLLAPPTYPDARTLLSRYNVAQVQVALFRAVRMRILATDDFKMILRYVKLSGLLHTIRRLGAARYEILIDGPASILRETRRYGVSMAKFLPGLLSCAGWTMSAEIQPRRKGWKAFLELSPKDGLTSPVPRPDEFDSTVEEGFFEKWGSEPRDGWRLVREGEVLFRGQKVFVPDFVFRHENGKVVYFEIVGFWTPEYLAAKVETLKAFEGYPILLAVAETVAEKMPELPARVVRFKTGILMSEVLDGLNALTDRSCRYDAKPARRTRT